jgi:signal transduction histidine kinase
LAVDQIVRSSTPLLRRLAKRAAITLQLGGQRALVALPSLDVERMLINLVVNAEHAMPEGGPLEIRTELCTLPTKTPATAGELDPGTYLVLSIEDHGEGIPDEVLPRIFEPLFTTKGDAGTGLGMSAVARIASSIGGGVNVHSHLGEGTSVAVFLPARVPSSTHPSGPEG